MLSTKAITATAGGVIGTGAVAVTAVSLTQQSDDKSNTIDESNSLKKSRHKEEQIDTRQMYSLEEDSWKLLFEFSKKVNLKNDSNDDSILKGDFEKFQEFCEKIYEDDQDIARSEKLCFTKVLGENAEHRIKYMKVIDGITMQTIDIIQQIQENNDEEEDSFLKQIKESSAPSKKMALLMEYCASKNWAENIPSKEKNYCSFANSIVI